MEYCLKTKYPVRREIIILLLLFLFHFSIYAQNIDSDIFRSKIAPDFVIIKVKETPSNFRTSEDLHQKIGSLIAIDVITPVVTNPPNGRVGTSTSGIERIYKVKLRKGENIKNVVFKLKNQEWIEYAEPLYLDQLFYIPNDPHATPGTGKQYHLTNINAYNAWNLHKGDTNMVIGIVDTGVDIDHPDLIPNISYNYDDPVNGFDDDGDGFLDNFMGWDMADNDNNPNTDGNGHGNIVAGISSAKTDNGIGLAGVGFNSRFLPIKILQNSSGYLVNSYEGVIYAANHGCQVINLSWGGPWNYSEFAQDVINYAVLDNDAVVVSAAGNTPDEIDFYPASYENVLSVTASDESNRLAAWATYSYYVDVMAPGQSIYSANKNGGYSDGGNGTSYSAPMVAGAAALVRQRFPLWDARQVMEQLRVTATNVSGIGENGNYEGKIGRGMLNVAKALSDSTLPSIRVKDYNFTGSYDEYIFPGDTIMVNASMINFLKEANNLEVAFSTEENKMVSGNTLITGSNLSTYEQLLLNNWEVIIHDDVEPNSRLLFKASINANNYSDWDYFQFRTAPWFINLKNNSLALTVASDGDLGYDRDSLFWGEGLWYGNTKLADYLGIIISRNNEYLANNVVNNYELMTRDQDFLKEKDIRMFNNSIANIDARSSFIENNTIGKNGLAIEQKVLAWDEQSDNDFFIIEYRLSNRSDSILNHINLALFSDWDIQNTSANTVKYDPATGIVYAFSPSSNNVYGGITLLQSADTSMYAIDLSDLNGHIPEMDIIFSDSLKIAYSKSDFVKIEAGNLSGGNDVASVTGYRNISLNPGESKKMAFVLMAADSKEQLTIQLDRAKTKYQQYLKNPPFENVFFACLGDSATIFFGENQPFEIYKDAAEIEKLDSTTSFKTHPILNDTIFYISKIVNGVKSDIRKIIVRPRNPKANFAPAFDTLLITKESIDTIRFKNQSVDAALFHWDMGNGYSSTNENPLASYEIPGSYQITLTIENDIGCIDTMKRTLVVAERSIKPLVKDQLICKGYSTEIIAQNTNQIAIYHSQALDTKLFEGESFVTGPLENSAIYYVTNADGNESLPVKIEINVSYPDLQFDYRMDTMDLDKKYLLELEGISTISNPLSWNINDEEFSGSIIHYDYENDSTIEIELIGVDSLSCYDTLKTTIIPQMSKEVALTNQEICINEQIDIHPEGGNLFYFYGDKDLTLLLHKGKVFKTGFIQQDTTFYVTNVDQLLEGKPGVVKVILKPLKAKIQIVPDSLNLATENTVLVRDISQGATESFWLFSNGSIDFSNEIEEVVEQEGIHLYTLIAKDGEECIDTATASLVAYYITGTDKIKGEIISYPNPVDDRLFIQLNTLKATNVDLLDDKGRVIKSMDNKDNDSNIIEFDMSTLLDGIYLLRLHLKDETIIKKVIVQH